MMQVKNGKGRMPRLLATGLAALLLAGCGADRDGGKATATASGDGAPAPAYSREGGSYYSPSSIPPSRRGCRTAASATRCCRGSTPPPP